MSPSTYAPAYRPSAPALTAHLTVSTYSDPRLPAVPVAKKCPRERGSLARRRAIHRTNGFDRSGTDGPAGVGDIKSCQLIVRVNIFWLSSSTTTAAASKRETLRRWYVETTVQAGAPAAHLQTAAGETKEKKSRCGSQWWSRASVRGGGAQVWSVERNEIWDTEDAQIGGGRRGARWSVRTGGKQSTREW